jgi:hypothetical protein
VPTYTINGKRIKTEAALTEDQIDEIASEINAAPAKTPAAAPARKDIFTKDTHSLVGGALQTFGDIGATLLSPADWLANKVLGENYDRRADIREGIQNMLNPDVESRAYIAGRSAPAIAGTMGVGSALATTARAVPALARFAPALETAGFGGKAVGNLPTRIAAGTVTGGTAAGLVNPEDAALGAALGGTLPLGGAIAGQVGKGGSWTWDALTGNLAKVNAGNMLREAAGDFLPGIQAANAANPNAMASTAAAEAGNPTYLSVMRIGEVKDPANTAFYAAQKVAADEQAALQRAAGGATQTEARTVRERTKDALDEVTRPMRERPLELANIGGTRGTALTKQAREADAASKLAVEDVRRFSAASERAQGRQYAEDFLPNGSNYPGQLSNRADAVAARRASDSLAAGETRREAEMRLASLKAAGLKPLTVDSVRSGISRRLADPEVAANPDAVAAFKNLDAMLEGFAGTDGVIRSEAMYAIRKNGINGVIEQLSRGMDPTARKKFAAQVTGEIKPLIDNAIEEAGGKGWTNYLDTYAEGMKDIERKELLGKALSLYESSPAQFRKLVEGNDPDTVESILGPGSYDIVQELQGQLGPLQKVVEGIKTRTMVGEKMKAGATAASDILSKNLMGKRVPNFLSPKIAITNAVLAELEGKVNAKTLKVLIEASQSGRAANEALATLPASERVKLFSMFNKNPTLSKWLGAGSAATSATNALAEQ